MFEQVSIDELSDFRFGHADNAQQGTGCTVIVAPEGACCGVDVSGGGPATRETDLLKPENMVEAVHAVVLAGGSAFGLEASTGVMEALSSRDIGFPMATTTIPIVTSACIFDLLVGEQGHPDKVIGKQAVEAAFSGKAFEQGNVGVGMGATVGKIKGPDHAMKSGFGYTVLSYGELTVGAFVAVNALGNIRNPQGGWLAGCRDDKGTIVDSVTAYVEVSEHLAAQAETPANTTIGVIVTNAKLSKAQATKVSTITNDAYARAIKPVHTSHDGDAIFTFASGKIDALPDLVAMIATEAMEQAIIEAVMSARSAYGLPSAFDLKSR